MKQRVAIARTLINKPKLLLMDEPFGALDPQTRWGMQGLLIDISRKEDNTILFVTHDVSEAVYLADTVFVLSEAAGADRSTASRFRTSPSATCRSSRRRSSATSRSSCSIYSIRNNNGATTRRGRPTRRYAFKNPYNYAIMGGFASAALLTGNWWLAARRRRRRGAVDAVRARLAPPAQGRGSTSATPRARRGAKAELDAKFKLLPEPDAMRCLALREKQEQINRLATENPAFTVDLLSGELKKLDDLVRAFLELSVTCARYQDYLRLGRRRRDRARLCGAITPSSTRGTSRRSARWRRRTSPCSRSARRSTPRFAATCRRRAGSSSSSRTPSGCSPIRS